MHAIMAQAYVPLAGIQMPVPKLQLIAPSMHSLSHGSRMEKAYGLAMALPRCGASSHREEAEQIDAYAILWTLGRQDGHRAPRRRSQTPPATEGDPPTSFCFWFFCLIVCGSVRCQSPVAGPNSY